MRRTHLRLPVSSRRPHRRDARRGRRPASTSSRGTSSASTRRRGNHDARRLPVRRAHPLDNAGCYSAEPSPDAKVNPPQATVVAAYPRIVDAVELMVRDLRALGLFAIVIVGLPVASLVLVLIGRRIAIAPLVLSASLAAAWFSYYALGWPNPGIVAFAWAFVAVLFGWLLLAVAEIWHRRPAWAPLIAAGGASVAWTLLFLIPVFQQEDVEYVASEDRSVADINLYAFVPAVVRWATGSRSWPLGATYLAFVDRTGRGCSRSLLRAVAEGTEPVSRKGPFMSGT